ncbi:uncharacterized protein OCT59_006362 [Rhizophagus irregularis]|uniref:uncharacterized protein n=1 Tax=Rhizophagus irregularis TaxID=588596 RepID=UPI0019EE3EE1|nr:hypothetical protein OCT59_006362 [Rhizophagus irregularis]GET57329.1 hypothetical protein GLOIN_2v1485807 [Rhizophagus irregularis DAOM 181602=DAOM 197198]
MYHQSLISYNRYIKGNLLAAIGMIWQLIESRCFPIRILISTTLSYRSGVNQATFDDLMNNKEPSAVRISLNDEEIYRSEDVEVTFGNLPENSVI